ncbi:MAG: hypothetical protein JST39_01405 [Bacteroidetes bacterium]|nr:hypothetical protein [Bacteroidota bacterium]
MRKKSSRIARQDYGAVKGTTIIKGTVDGKRQVTFRFSVVTPAQQLRERNKAYTFFQL